MEAVGIGVLTIALTAVILFTIAGTIVKNPATVTIINYTIRARISAIFMLKNTTDPTELMTATSTVVNRTTVKMDNIQPVNSIFAVQQILATNPPDRTAAG